MFRRHSAIALLITIFITSLLAWPVLADNLAGDFVVADPPKPLPSLSFLDAKGRTLSLEDFRGHFVLLNLWATWCGPCVSEMPSLAELQNKIAPHQLTVLTLNEDHDGQTAATAFFSRYDITSLVAYIDDSGRAPSRLHAHGLPTTILIDPAGLEIGRIMGAADWASPEAIAFLKAKMGLAQND